MRTPFLLLATASILKIAPLSAQEIPGELAGDIGWVLHGTDTLTLVRAADGHVWLQQNLGSTEVATAVDMNSAYGDLYQWGRWNDGHQLRTSATAPVTVLAANDPSGLGVGSPLFYTGTDPLHWWSNGAGTDGWQGTVASAVKGIDPCTAIGDGWQLPSQTDWMNVLAMEGVMGLASALTSNLRLPAAGSRHALTGTLINEGSFGNYWCSTPSGIYAKDLTIGDNFVNADDDGYRGYGMSCRCLNRNLHTGMHETTNKEVAFFPNPSSGTFTLQCDEVVLRMVLLDATARVVATIPLNAMNPTVELPDLAAGLHLVRLELMGGVRHAALVIAK